MTISPMLFPAVTVTVVSDRTIRTAIRINLTTGFVTVPSWEKIIIDNFILKLKYIIIYLSYIASDMLFFLQNNMCLLNYNCE